VRGDGRGGTVAGVPGAAGRAGVAIPATGRRAGHDNFIMLRPGRSAAAGAGLRWGQRPGQWRHRGHARAGGDEGRIVRVNTDAGGVGKLGAAG